jgi:16S rRNA (cytosine1402-N4)-methyltransferase
MSLTMTIPVHKSVLLNEVIEALGPQPGKRYVDCTLGSGGHAEAILAKILPGGHLLGIDADPMAIEIARSRLADYIENITLVNDNFLNLQSICEENEFLPAQGILFDLGLSSAQLDNPERGFSFQQYGPLDMRFDPTQQFTVADVINTFSEEKLTEIISDYGQERFSRRIARSIVNSRPINSTLELVDAIEKATGGYRAKIHPATRTFMALRIYINHELENLAATLKQALNCLDRGGRLAVISYHSLEDRIVKQFMQTESKGCICSPDVPICQCGHIATLRIINRKVISPSTEEIGANPRSRSAKLRVAERL